MVRNYVKKRNVEVRDNKIRKGINYMLENDDVSMRSAARKADISFSTFYFHLLNKAYGTDELRRVGCLPSLPKDTEEELAACFRRMSEWGFGLSKKEIQAEVYKFIQQNACKDTALGAYLRRYCRFVNYMPGSDWMLRFMLSHQLSARRSRSLDKAKVSIARDPFFIYGFYDALENETFRLELASSPQNIFSLYEMDLSTVVRGERSASDIIPTHGSWHTVMACASADGSVQPPLIIFHGVQVESNWKGENTIPGTCYGASENGWMTETVLETWFDFFCENIVERPLILLYDGRNTRLSINLVQKAINQCISFIKLPTRTTQTLQPLEVYCSAELKEHWSEMLLAKQLNTAEANIPKAVFSDMVSEAWLNAFSRENIIYGFSSTGIYPFNRECYPLTEFSTSSLQEYKKASFGYKVQDLSVSFYKHFSSEVGQYVPHSSSRQQLELDSQENGSDVIANELLDPSILKHPFIKDSDSLALENEPYMLPQTGSTVISLEQQLNSYSQKSDTSMLSDKNIQELLVCKMEAAQSKRMQRRALRISRQNSHRLNDSCLPHKIGKHSKRVSFNKRKGRQSHIIDKGIIPRPTEESPRISSRGRYLKKKFRIDEEEDDGILEKLLFAAEQLEKKPISSKTHSKVPCIQVIMLPPVKKATARKSFTKHSTVVPTVHYLTPANLPNPSEEEPSD